jgi:glycerol kinase
VVQETTALGAAWLAGMAEGVWGSAAEVASQWRLDREVLPAAGRAAADRAWSGWRRAVERSLAWERSPTAG